MRIVMPLFDFFNDSGQEFEFGDGTYSLRRFAPETDIPNDTPGLSTQEIKQIKLERWALVAENPDRNTYTQDINRLLLSFKIHTLGKLFIKYRLCVDDPSLCRVIQERMNFILREKSPRTISLEQLNQVNIGFERLQEMDAIDSVSNRTHNAIYFMYGAYFAAGHALYLFVLLFTVLEALFSKEEGGAATETICKRVSSFLGSPARCTYPDIKRLYNIRSELVHGRRKASPSGGNLADAHELEFVVTECMKKMLSERVYLRYRDLADKEQYFNKLTSMSWGRLKSPL
jgi:hypothetical protein